MSENIKAAKGFVTADGVLPIDYNYLANKPPIENGAGAYSISMGHGNKSITDYSTSIGDRTISGSKGYYIKSIDIVNKKIYLSNIKEVPAVSTVDNTDTAFETPGYKVGDMVTILAKTELGESHLIDCTKITSITNNVIGYSTELPFKELLVTNDPYPVLFCINKVEIGSVVIGTAGYSEGVTTTSAGWASHAEGRGSIAAARYSHAEGRNTIAGYAAHSEGITTRATGMYSHAEGQKTTATGSKAHAEGCQTKASGEASHAEGYLTEAKGLAAHSEGDITIASGHSSHAEGCVSKAQGDQSHAEGDHTTASGKGAHAEGCQTTSSGEGAHSEGYNTIASGNAAHSEGFGTKAIGDDSHAEGHNTTASGKYAHAEGVMTSAKGIGSHAEGNTTIASSDYQHVEGKYNIEDSNNKYVHIVGNGTGTNTNRSNAHTLDWDGNGWYAGSVTVGRATTDDDNDLVLVSKGYLKSCLENLKAEILAEISNS